MSDLNGVPQVALALFIIWLMVSGCGILALASFVRSIAHTLRDWHEEWLYLQNGDKPAPKAEEKLDLKDPKVRMAKARAARKKGSDDD